MIGLRELQQDRGVLFAVLAVAYGLVVAVADNLYAAASGAEAWGVNTWAAHLFFYGWLALFVWLGVRSPRHRAKLFLSGVIPVALLALALLFTWPIHLPTVLLMAVALYYARIRMS